MIRFYENIKPESLVEKAETWHNSLERLGNLPSKMQFMFWQVDLDNLLNNTA